MARLKLPVREQLRDLTPSGPAVDRLLAATHERLERAEQGARWRGRALVLLPGAAVAVAAVLFVMRPQPLAQGPLELEGGGAVARLEAGAEAKTFRFRDGGRVVLDPDTALETLANDGAGIELALRRGRARLEVKPGPRRYVLELLGYRAQTAGAELSAWRNEQEVGVVVFTGEVVLRGDGEPRTLGAGQTFRHALPGAPPTTNDSTHSATAPPTPTTPAAPAALAPPPATRAGWRALASEKRFDQAWDTLGERGVRDAARAASTVDDLLQLADVARLSGHAAESLPLLLRVEKEFPSDPRAALAAFTRGRVLGDNLRRPAEAADAFDAALGLGLPDALGETAAFRVVSARKAAGDHAAAVAAARRYLERYPAGAHRGDVDRVLSEP